MSNPAQRSRRQAYIAQRRIRGGDVIYTTTDDLSLQIRVIPARTVTRVEDSDARTQLRSFVRDFLILPEDLVDPDDEDETQIWPQAGDTITEADGAVYEVVRDLHGEPGWRWDDQQTKQVIRVHTQIIAGT